MIKKKYRRFLYYYLFPYAGLFLVRLLSATYRIKIVDPDNEQNILEAGGRLVYASWHQRFFPGLTFLSTRKPIACIISQSHDGEIVARAATILGWRAVRGSSSHGGRQALETIKGLVDQGYKVGHAVDGPRGPFGTVKPGLIRIAQYADMPIACIISQSHDGEIVARAATILGWRTVRGSSSHGGRQALETIKRLVDQGYKVGHAVDGPRGPFGTVKPGLIRIAQYADMPIVPIIISGQNRWVFNSWDRFMVPKPFSRLIIRFGAPVYVPRDMGRGEFKQMQARVAQDLKQLYADTDAIWRDEARIKEIFG